ncbi:MAG: NYN domain-containing protein [Chitinivibrionales bacterium]|nr:NYN domain-containing protein [Chitinivibrionales bacterium]MBD3357632.1 NYN domain-containing protein [Chitinivibrionales bacterium]
MLIAPTVFQAPPKRPSHDLNYFQNYEKALRRGAARPASHHIWREEERWVNNYTKRLWLIDAGYLFNAQKSVGRDYQFDYMKLRQKLEESGPLWRAYYFSATPDATTDAQDNFHSWLRSAGPRGPKIITKLYQLKQVDADRAYCADCSTKVNLSCPNGHFHSLRNYQQKGVDVGIATLALTHQERYDALVLSTGDGDFLDMVEFLSETGKRIELLVFREGVSTDLQARADVVHWIDDFADDVKRGFSGPVRACEDDVAVYTYPRPKG